MHIPVSLARIVPRRINVGIFRLHQYSDDVPIHRIQEHLRKVVFFDDLLAFFLHKSLRERFHFVDNFIPLAKPF